jgi:predicted TIM-barrel fold metal-dependent hydrolase
MKKGICGIVLLIFAIGACGKKVAAQSSQTASLSGIPVNGPFSPRELQEFTALEPIDTHAHDYLNNPIFVAMFHKLHLYVVDIIVIDPSKSGTGLPRPDESAQRKAVWDVARSSDGHAAICTSFNALKVNRPDFDETVIRQLNQDFDHGAIAVKIWKNIGMEIRDKSGIYIMPDNPVFEPIYRDIAAHNKTLIAHLAEPDQSWEPLNPASPDYKYYLGHLEWYMYNKPHAPSKEQILRARDHILEQNPTLRVVGAHLGSMESNFTDLGVHFDRYPNFAVDLAARMTYLMLLPRAEAIAFVTKYQDRLIYGTDHALFPSAASDLQKNAASWEVSYARDWRALATSDTVTFNGRNVQGLALPQPILRKLYHDNAVKWFPGILGSQ